MEEETHYSNNSLKGKFLPVHLPRSSMVAKEMGIKKDRSLWEYLLWEIGGVRKNYQDG